MFKVFETDFNLNTKKELPFTCDEFAEAKLYAKVLALPYYCKHKGDKIVYLNSEKECRVMNSSGELLNIGGTIEEC